MGAEMKFPKPWTIVQTGPYDFLVADANGCKLFYIVGDEGDGTEETPPKCDRLG